MALFIFLAVVPGGRQWDALCPPDGHSQAGCAAPSFSGATAGWKSDRPTQELQGDAGVAELLPSPMEAKQAGPWLVDP